MTGVDSLENILFTSTLQAFLQKIPGCAMSCRERVQVMVDGTPVQAR